MAELHYITPIDLVVVHELLISHFGGMRGITEAGFGRLESAAAAPRASVFGADLYADLPAKAAALCFAIVREHPFTDGNKRVALAALDLFLTSNGRALGATNADAYETIMATARGELQREQLAAWVARQIARGPDERVRDDALPGA